VRLPKLHFQELENENMIIVLAISKERIMY